MYKPNTYISSSYKFNCTKPVIMLLIIFPTSGGLSLVGSFTATKRIRAMMKPGNEAILNAHLQPIEIRM